MATSGELILFDSRGEEEREQMLRLRRSAGEGLKMKEEKTDIDTEEESNNQPVDHRHRLQLHHHHHHHNSRYDSSSQSQPTSQQQCSQQRFLSLSIIAKKMLRSNNNKSKSNSETIWSILLSILLPLLVVLLLPTIEYHNNQNASTNYNTETTITETTDRQLNEQLHQQLHQSNGITTSVKFDGQQYNEIPSDQHSNGWSQLANACEFLQQLVKFPLDRFRLGSGLVSLSQAKEIVSKHDLLEEEQQTNNMLLVAPAEHRASYMAAPQQQQPGLGHGYGGPGPVDTMDGGLPPGSGEPNENSMSELGGGIGGEVGVGTSSQSGQALQTRAELPAVRALNVKCEKNHMTVNIVFDRPFYGLVFSKGHYNDQKCVHLPANSGQTSVNFDIHLGKCGMSSSDASGATSHSTGLQRDSQQGNPNQPNGLYIENTIIIQYDPQVQEIYDQARKLRCTWYDYYEKSVTFRPYNVDMLDAVTANFLGDNIQCWMQIQVGKGPWEHEVAGIVKIGQTMTMVLAIKDDENKFDMLVRNCVAHDGKHAPIQLVDEYGCVARPKIMAKFQKIRKFASPAATVVSYAHFQAFKFPDSMSVHFQCVIQVCRYECPEPVCNNQLASGGGGNGGNGDTGPPGLSGPHSGGSGSNNGDYAASGTELVASKEPVPSYALPPVGSITAFNESSLAGGHSSHALKLDESQGRVQVKLDTSMMAGLSGGRPSYSSQQRAASGSAQAPLPPHLLHMAPPSPLSSSHHNPHRLAATASTPTTVSGSITSGHAFLSSAPYHRSGPGVTSTSSSAAHRQHHQPVAGHKVGSPMSTSLNSASGQQLAPPLGGYSPAYPPPQLPSSTTPHVGSYQSPAPRVSHYSGASGLSNRMGELATPPGAGMDSEDEMSHNDNLNNLNQPGNPLSLIALPRGLRMAPATISMMPVAASTASFSTATATTTFKPPNHRFKRTVDHNQQETGDGSTGRQARGTQQQQQQQESTAIKTQKTIQVVSPEDVAFSLLADELIAGDGDRWSSSGKPITRQLQQQQQQLNSTVCFSAARLILVILVTLVTLVGGVVIAAYVIFKQRSRLEQKLSTVYEIHDHMDGGQQVASAVAAAESLARQQQEAQLIARRQREELHQRHSYLARLYSQFAPNATHWPQ